MNEHINNLQAKLDAAKMIRGAILKAQEVLKLGGLDEDDANCAITEAFEAWQNE